MFGHRHKFRGEHPFLHMAGRFGGRGGFGPFGGHGMRGGGRGGPGDMLRAGRMLGDGDLKLITLALLSQTPRHGYDIIKALEAKFQGAYSPSPGAIYPMLQMLEEADLVVSEANGNKRRYAITEQGRAYLAEHAAELARINAQIDEASEDAGAVSLGDEVRGVAKAVFMRVRRGTLDAAQARKVRDILKKARREIEDL